MGLLNLVKLMAIVISVASCQFFMLLCRFLLLRCQGLFYYENIFLFKIICYSLADCRSNAYKHATIACRSLETQQEFLDRTG